MRMLTRIRNNPNLAGAALAVFAFAATMLIAPPIQLAMRTPTSSETFSWAAVSWESVLGLSLALAALAFYKGRRAVQKRLGGE